MTENYYSRHAPGARLTIFLSALPIARFPPEVYNWFQFIITRSQIICNSAITPGMLKQLEQLVNN